MAPYKQNQTRLSSSSCSRFNLFSPLNSLVSYLVMIITNRSVFFQSFNLIRLCGLFYCAVGSRRRCRSIEDTLTSPPSPPLCYVSACHLSSTGWRLGLLHSLIGVYGASPKNSSHAGLQMPPAICQLYAARTVGYAN